MADFLISYAPLKAFEGGWCNVKGDAGGETYAGIARNFSRTGRAGRSLTRKKATLPSVRVPPPFPPTSPRFPACGTW